jgi:hypothetical protein
MESGLLALCTGRPEPVSVRFSPDGGVTWINQTQVAKSDEVNLPDKPYARQKSTCYTGMVEVEPGKLLVVYDHLPFVQGWGLNPDNEPTAVNSIQGTFLKVTR